MATSSKSEFRYVKGKGLTLKKLKHNHYQIMDYMLSNPGATQTEIARAMKITPAWLSQVINSDLFKEEYKRQYSQVRDMRDHRLVNRIYDLAEKSLDTVVAVLEDEEAPASVKVQANKNMLTALGFMGGGSSVTVNNSETTVNAQKAQVNQGVDRAELEEARQRRAERLGGRAGGE